MVKWWHAGSEDGNMVVCMYCHCALTVQSTRSRVRSCLVAIEKVQSVHDRTNTEPAHGPTSTRHRLRLSSCACEQWSAMTMVVSVQSSITISVPWTTPGFRTTSPPSCPEMEKVDRKAHPRLNSSKSILPSPLSSQRFTKRLASSSPYLQRNVLSVG